MKSDTISTIRKFPTDYNLIKMRFFILGIFTWCQQLPKWQTAV